MNAAGMKTLRRTLCVGQLAGRVGKINQDYAMQDAMGPDGVKSKAPGSVRCPLRAVLGDAGMGRLSAVLRRGMGGGFTLIELLIVIAIIAVLIAILLPGIAHCTYLSRQARELSAGRQLMVAFNLYADGNKGAVLPGYPTRSQVNGPMVVNDDAGERILNEDAQRYPWRLAPYLNYEFRGLYSEEKLLMELQQKRNEYGQYGVDYRYVVSLFPSLGMNVTFVGGTDRLGQFDPGYDQRVGAGVVVRRMDQVTRPTQLITFASARCEVQPLLPQIGAPQGYFRVEPPYLGAGQGLRWSQAYDAQAEYPGLASGFVAQRRTGKTVAALFDGHAEVFSYDQMKDMQKWCDRADRADWTLP